MLLVQCLNYFKGKLIKYKFNSLQVVSPKLSTGKTPLTSSLCPCSVLCNSTFPHKVILFLDIIKI